MVIILYIGVVFPFKGLLLLDYHNFYFLMILKETLTILSLSNPVLQYTLTMVICWPGIINRQEMDLITVNYEIILVIILYIYSYKNYCTYKCLCFWHFYVWNAFAIFYSDFRRLILLKTFQKFFHDCSALQNHI